MNTSTPIKYSIIRSLFCFACYFVVVHATSPEDCFGGIDHTPYLDWVSSRGSLYTTSVCFNATKTTDVTQAVAVHWKVDDDNMYIAVTARSNGWVGFGFTDSGGMKGADMVIFETGYPNKVRDAHVLKERLPIDDLCQDWVYRNSTISDGFVTFEAYRKLDTMDSQDYKIIDDTFTAIPAQHVIAAWGESSMLSYHAYTASGAVRWYVGGNELEFVHKSIEKHASGFFDLLVPNYTIGNGTDYASFCFSWDPDLTMQGVPPDSNIALIAAEMIVRDHAKPYVHHSDVFASSTESNTSTCLKNYGYTLYSWAPGVLPFLLPENVGYAIGPTSPDGLQSFRVQIHYNNPDNIPNVVDNGGLRVYYSLQPRENELGIFAMGDALSHLEGVDIPKGYSEYGFDCDSQCSTLVLNGEPVTVIQEMFHMHVEGSAAATYQIRNGEIIRQANIDFFDFNFLGIPAVRQAPFTIMPGDSFISKFVFDSKNGTKFGIGTYEEMNKAIMLYYPAKSLVGNPWGCVYDIPIVSCNATYSERVLSTFEDIDHVFGPAPAMCHEKASISTNDDAPTSNGMFYNSFQSTISTLSLSLIACLALWM